MRHSNNWQNAGDEEIRFIIVEKISDYYKFSLEFRPKMSNWKDTWMLSSLSPKMKVE